MMMKTILFSAGATMLALTGCSKTTDPSPAGTETSGNDPCTSGNCGHNHGHGHGEASHDKHEHGDGHHGHPSQCSKKHSIPKTCNLNFSFDSKIDYKLPWNQAGETVKTVSINAGNQNLQVGGSNINGMWKSYLHTQQQISEQPPVWRAGGEKGYEKGYGKMHSHLLESSSKTSPTTYQDLHMLGWSRDTWLFGLKLFSSTGKAAHTNESTGAVFLDIFDRTFEPRKSHSNDVGMLYVVGPDARSDFINNDKKRFLDEVKNVAKNSVELVHHHNNKCGKTNKIENLRWYFVSGGIFRGDKGKELATEEEVAEATIQGMIAVDSTEKLQITFAHEKKGVNVFETTMGQKFEKA